MSLLILSFFAWILSVLAPCVLPVLPVILGSSLGAQKRYRPLIIVLSTSFFIVLFTVILKVSTAFINISQGFRTWLSAVIIILYGATLVRPLLRDRVSEKLWLYRANEFAEKAKTHWWVRWDILLWASLGPIFASCSPTYALLLSVVFPQSTTQWILYTLVYALWFAVLLLVFAYGWRAIIKKFTRASNPRWWFKKWLWVLLILTWLLIVSWYMKKLEVALTGWVFDVTRIEQTFLRDIPLWTASQMQPGQGQGNRVENSYQNDNSTAPWKKLLNENYPAPELAWLKNRLNGWNYTSMEELKGKVVVIDFWTYSCVNCIRTLDALKSWDAKYSQSGLVIIGVHAPEFQFEKYIKNVQNAVTEYGLKYPVVQDNDFTTRRNYNNRFWPAKYIIDKEWTVRFSHFGEWEYEETEQVIQYLLWVEWPTSTNESTKAYGNLYQSHETYLGYLRADKAMQSKTPNIQLWQRWFDGTWKQEPEYQMLESNAGSLFMKFNASEINLVMGNNRGVTTADVYIDGKMTNTLYVQENKMYNLWTWSTFGEHTIEIRYKGKGVETYAFTFW